MCIRWKQQRLRGGFGNRRRESSGAEPWNDTFSASCKSAPIVASLVRLTRTIRMQRLARQKDFSHRIGRYAMESADLTSQIPSLEVDDPALERDGDRVGAIVGAKFGQDIFDVRLHGLLGNGQLRCNNLVRVPRRDFPQYFDLALR